MALFALAVLLLAFTGSSSATWCVCKEGSDAILQKTLDYACGAGADCNPLHQNGPCFQPNTVRAHCNYAVNSYFQRKGQAQGSCDFAGTATVTASDPSTGGCSYPASARIRKCLMSLPLRDQWMEKEESVVHDIHWLRKSLYLSSLFGRIGPICCCDQPGRE
ncbi:PLASMODESMATA CALLOSE-BINDING PROTEIN 3-like isoform X2 [Glycine soja]|uniref:Plasmodesmata callose-binding protein 3 n=1 Tax=Glycine soja TaxID=3848 RepID=A0A445KCG1_GLYSO|nr:PLASMODESMATA CALLOSE-BINDING PROTEIN 3-like isoform X2 [Glycine soja]RZC08433.1 Plasmodesmata callose-binding protein 3 [Glycine soja]